MPSGHYTIDDTNRSRGDTSFRACVIALLIFLLFCVTIIIVLLLVKKGAGSGTDAESEHGGTSSMHTGGEPDKGHRRRPENGSEETTPSAAQATPESRTPEGNITITSTGPPLKTSRNGSRDGSHSETHRDLGSVETSTENLTSTSSEPPKSTSIDPSALPEPRRSLEGSVETPDNLTTSTEHPSRSAGSLTTPSLPPPSVKPVPCESPTCKRLAANILSTMGLNADPCKQFYEYACGGVRENKYMLVPDYEDEAWQRINIMVDTINSSHPESYRKFKTLMQSCRTYDPVRDIHMWKYTVLKEIQELGDIAVEDADFSQNFTRLFLGLLQHDRPFIFEVTLDINDKAPSKFAVKIFPAQMAENQLFPEDNEECQLQAAAKHKNLNNIYYESLHCMNKTTGRRKVLDAAKEALLTLGIFNSSETVKLNKTLNDFEEFLNQNIEALGERSALKLELQDRVPDMETVKTLNEMFKDGLKVNWSSIFEKIVGRALKEGEEVQVYSNSYFRDIEDKFKTKQRQLHNALLVAFAASRYRDLVVEQRWRPRVDPTHCTRIAAHLLPDVASALYLHSFSNDLRLQLEQKIGNFVFEITDNFLMELDDASWLNEGATATFNDELRSKFSTIQEARNITDHVSEAGGTGKLDAALKDYTLDEAGFIENAVMLMIRNRERLYKRIDEEPIKNIWTHFITPYATKGVSLYSLNLIAIPLGAIQKPFYDPEYLSHMRMAGLGFTVAHEMAHHIDSFGIKFNTPRTDKSIKDDYISRIPGIPSYKGDVNIEYLNLTESNKHKYVPFEFSESERLLKVNEVFADKIAIRLAYKAYKANEKKMNETLPYLPLTNDQSFFVFLAQTFCTKLDFFSMVLDFFESSNFPPETRVKNMVEGYSTFYNAFNCTVPDDIDFPFPYGPEPFDLSRA